MEGAGCAAATTAAATTAAAATPAGVELTDSDVAWARGVTRWVVRYLQVGKDRNLVEEAEAGGLEGLFEASRRYVPGGRASFRTYAAPWVRWKAHEAIWFALGQRKGRGRKRLLTTLDGAPPGSEGKEDEPSRKERLQAPEDPEVRKAAFTETVRRLKRQVRGREKRIVDLLASGATRGEVARELGVSRESVRQIVWKMRDRLLEQPGVREMLKACGMGGVVNEWRETREAEQRAARLRGELRRMGNEMSKLLRILDLEELGRKLGRASAPILAKTPPHRAAALLGKSVREILEMHAAGLRCDGPEEYVPHPKDEFPGQAHFLVEHLTPLACEVVLASIRPLFERCESVLKHIAATVPKDHKSLDVAAMQALWDDAIEALRGHDPGTN